MNPEEQYQAWAKNFDERQRKEISFAVLYAKEFAHGTDGHNAKMIIAKMAEVLTAQEKNIAELLERSGWRESTMAALQQSPLANLAP